MAKTGISPTLEDKTSLSFSDSTSDIKTLMQSSAIYDKYQMDWYNKFARTAILDPYNTLTGTKEYVFITKPDLCILNQNGGVNNALKESAFFNDAVNRYKQAAMQLQSSYNSSSGPFMAMLSNALTSSLEVPGISAEMIETAGNLIGTKISYRGTSIKSDEDLDFTLEFEDTKYLDIYMLFKMYDEYEKLKWLGAIDYTKADSDRWKNYIINKVLHDQVTMYKFIVADDGYRIIYWARITGCVPTTIPRDAFSDTTDSFQQKLTVGWKGHFVRDMDPIIISQFNSLVESHIVNKRELPLFNQDTLRFDGRWASMPYIEIRTTNNATRLENNRREYFLKWAM